MLKDEGKEEKGFWGEEQGKRALGCKAFAMHFDILQAWNFCRNVWLVFLAKKMTNASGINRKVFSKYFLQYATVFWLLNGSNIYKYLAILIKIWSTTYTLLNRTLSFKNQAKQINWIIFRCGLLWTRSFLMSLRNISGAIWEKQKFVTSSTVIKTWWHQKIFTRNSIRWCGKKWKIIPSHQ